MTESQSLAEDYIGYFRDGVLGSGAEFAVDEHQIRIWQEVDDEDEPDKYYIIRDDVEEETWNELVALIEE